jgi:hypothetical protein
MAIFDNIVQQDNNFKGYTGNPPTTGAEYDALDCWTDASIKPTWADISSDMALAEVQQNRATEYPSLTDQADMAYWDRQNGTTTLDDAIAAVKDANPKP